MRAIAEVCDPIAFVGADDDDQYLGYWRGPRKREIADSPIVLLDNEGQFELIPGSNLAEALLGLAVEADRFEELRDWMRSIGLEIGCESPEVLKEPGDPDPPESLHDQLFLRDRGEQST